jgi:hypothetical protein
VKVEGPYIDDGYLSDFTHSDGTLTYTGTDYKLFLVVGRFVVYDFGAVVYDYSATLRVNGSVEKRMESGERGSGTKSKTFTIRGIADISPNDTVDVCAYFRGPTGSFIDVSIFNLTLTEIAGRDLNISE